MKPRPPRRTLYRQARTLPPHLAHRAILAALERSSMPAHVDVAQMTALFDKIGGGAVWSVAELKRLRLLPRDANGRRLGQALAELADHGRGLGRWSVARVDTGTKKLAEGRLWRLHRRW